MNPTKLGPYELVGILGRGGMGTVYRAKHEHSGQLVALKSLTPTHAEDTHFRQRFESEIQALLKLDHPNIVRLLSYGQEQGVLFFAMELVDGKSLFQLQREQKQFDWRQVLQMARDIASGLRHAHDRGIIHRDLKPGNLLFDKSGHVKITDFGIAKLFGKSHDTRDNVLGTIDFMSPEQALGRPVTVRSDLYSLGVVLFSLLSGQPPFAGNSIEESLRNLTKVPAPRIRATVPSVPQPVDDLLDELLAKKPEDRIPTALALLKRLDAVEQELIHMSEAQTAHGQPGSQPHPDRTFEVNQPHTVKEKSGSRPNSPAPSPATIGKSSHATGKQQRVEPSSPAIKNSNETVAQTDVELQIEPPAPKKLHDYFSTVTDHQRRQHSIGTEETDAHSSRGWFVLFLLLIGLVAGISYAVYQATRTPSAEVLFTKIEAAGANPDRARQEIKTFLSAYPEDERAPRVEKLQELVDAITLYKRLSLLRNAPAANGLSLVQRQFVEIIDLSYDNAAVGYSRLQAFVELHDAGDDTTEETLSLVNAAKAFSEKVKNEARTQVNWDRQKIQDALQRAAENPDDAKELLNSIVLLYSDIDWAADLVEEARRRLQ